LERLQAFDGSCTTTPRQYSRDALAALQAALFRRIPSLVLVDIDDLCENVDKVAQEDGCPLLRYLQSLTSDVAKR
jgi:hypothetical protein